MCSNVDVRARAQALALVFDSVTDCLAGLYSTNREDCRPISSSALDLGRRV